MNYKYIKNYNIFKCINLIYLRRLSLSNPRVIKHTQPLKSQAFDQFTDTTTAHPAWYRNGPAAT
jgi:hypothetical protein